MFALFALYLHYFALYLHRCFVRCSSCPISTLHCAGWAGLGWLGWGQCPVSPRGQLQPRGDMAGADTGAHAYTLHYTHARQCYVARRMDSPSSRVFTMCHAMAWPYCGAAAHAVMFVSSYSLHYFSVDIAL